MDRHLARYEGTPIRINEVLRRQICSGVCSFIESPFHNFLLHFLNYSSKEDNIALPVSFLFKRLLQSQWCKITKDSRIKKDGSWLFPWSRLFPGSVMDLNEWIKKCAPPLLFTYCKQSNSIKLTFLQLEGSCMTTSSREMSPEPRALHQMKSVLYRLSPLNITQDTFAYAKLLRALQQQRNHFKWITQNFQILFNCLY